MAEAEAQMRQGGCIEILQELCATQAQDAYAARLFAPPGRPCCCLTASPVGSGFCRSQVPSQFLREGANRSAWGRRGASWGDLGASWELSGGSGMMLGRSWGLLGGRLSLGVFFGCV